MANTKVMTPRERALLSAQQWRQLFDLLHNLTTEERAAYWRLTGEAGDKPLSPTDRLAILDRAKKSVALKPLLDAEAAKPPEQHRRDLFG